MDDVDRAQVLQELQLNESIKNNRKDIPKGKPGDCDLCGEFTTRLVQGACAPCRDLYNLS